MNLADNPTEKDVRELLASVDDDAGHHALWVDRGGEVHVTELPDDLTPAQWTEQNTALKFRFETCDPGNGYVGAKAAGDQRYVRRLFDALVRGWKGRLGRLHRRVVSPRDSSTVRRPRPAAFQIAIDKGAPPATLSA